MKRILTLILVVGMILGLAAPAWAAGESISVTGPASTVGWQGKINFSVSVTTLDPAANYTILCGNTVIKTTATGIASDTFDYSVNAIDIAPNGEGKVNQPFVFTLNNNSAGETISFPVNVNIAAKPELSSGDITVSCGPHSYSAALSGTAFSFTLDAACAANNDTITFGYAKQGTSGLTVTFDGGTTFVAGSISAGASFTKKITVSNNIDQPVTYNMIITRPATGNKNILTAISLKNGSTTVGNEISGTIADNYSQTITVPSTYTGPATVTANWTLAPTAQLVSATWGGAAITPGSTVTLPAAGNNTALVIIVKASDNNNYTATITVTRAAGNNTILNSVSLRDVANGGGSLVDSNLTLVSGSNATPLPLSISNSYATTPNFYVNWSVPSGVSVTGVTWQNSGSSTVTSIGTTSGTSAFNMPAATPSGTLKITAIATDNQSYTATYTVTRASTAVNLLSSVTFTPASGSANSLGAINSSSATQSINLNTTATSTNVSWVLASGATMMSYRWGTSGNFTSTTATSITSAALPTSGSTTLAIVVRVNDVDYTVTINVTKNGTGTLSNLYIKNEATSNTNSRYLFETSPSNFSGSTYNYTVYVESDYDTIYVYPVKNNSSDSLTVDGSYSKMTNRFNASGYYEIDLKSSGNKVNITVNNGTKYVLTIERTANVVRNASLDSLKVSKSSSSTTSSNTYDLSPSFAYNRVNYSADIPKNVTEVYLHFSTHRSGLTPSVSGATKVSDGVYKATLTPNKTKTVTITVSYSGDSTKYTIDLNNGSASSTARLDKIRVASRESTNSNYQYTLSPVFDSSVLDYVALVPYTTANYVYVQATLDDDDDTLTIDGVTVDSDDWEEISITRSSGKKTSVPIKVKDDNGNTTTYNLVVVAAPKSADDTATLDSLSVRTGSSTSTALTLSPSFSSTTYNYTTSNVANTVDSVRVYAEADDSAAWVIVNGNLLSSSSDYAEVALEEGKNTIKVVVYAEDCETNKTYEITVNRGATGGSDSTLSGLEVRYGTSATQTLNLFPSFNKSTLNYNTNVDSSVAQIAFRPTTTDSTATILVKGMAETSGNWTSYNALSSGTNTFSIIVTSGDKKNMSVYTVTVERGLDVRVSTQSLKVNGTTVTCAAYNINGNNYFKLRDIAYALRGTTKNFNIGYNNSTRLITLTSNSAYTPVGGEMVKPKATGKCLLSNQPIMKDGLTINLTAYNIDDNNYFMLREIGELFNFGVDYDTSSNTVLVDSSKIYTAPQ